MQDINPVKKTINVTENTLPDDVPFREQIGVEDIPATAAPASERVNFSSLYTPESRRNVVQKPQSSMPRPQMAPPKKASVTKIVLITALILFVLATVIYTYVFGNVTVQVQPLRKQIEVNQVVSISQTDIELGDVAKLVSATSSKSKKIERRGSAKVETKSSGTIVIYNNFDKNPQKLITNTRFESKEGKIYRIAESVTVPGMVGSTPGSIEAVVYADSVGEDYNITSTDLTIPGFKGTPRFEKFSAKTKTPFTGGFSGIQETVADEDVEKAKQELAQNLEEEAKEALTVFSPGEEYVLLSDTVKFSHSDNKKDLVTDKDLEYKVTVTASAYFVKKEYIANKILDKENISPDTDKLHVEDFSKITFASVPNQADKAPSNGIQFTVIGSPVFISDLDEAIIATTLAGAKKSEFSDKMSRFSGIVEAEPNFNPPWLGSFPKDTKQIHLKIIK